MAGEYDSDYQVVRLDLAQYAGKDRQEIVQGGRPIAALTIVQLPAGAIGNVQIHFGEQGDGIPLRQEALSIGRNPPRSSGVYMTVAAAQVGILILLIGIDLSVQA